MTTHTTQTIQHSRLCFRNLGTTGWLAACAGLLLWGTTSAYALSSTNGLAVNALSANGIQLNALTANGLPQSLGVCSAPKLDSEIPPPAPAHSLPWHRLSQQALGKP
jgi:hypothetical protein